VSEQEAAEAQAEAHERIDKLLDAIELVKANRRSEARHVLRDLIREDNDFEDAWLWMSVAVDSLATPKRRGRSTASVCRSGKWRSGAAASAFTAIWRRRSSGS
jgi:hypothetical protein